ncbi:type II toxin-antitoxin system HipA family toxin [Nocardia exalbida]|uniref:type II toxin-antitoxin system HipA family toxin n=1 Tax=Nocardia exalbida TaxID=290231 RepID=UPI00247A3A04|nr:HipA domain-containing protein [Nocardia exalbida]
MFGVPEAELGALKLAAVAGINSADGFLVDVTSVSGLEDYSRNAHGQALAVHRFDRKTNDLRVHMEELAQIIDIPTAKQDAKYRMANFEMVATLISGLVGVESVGEVVDRIVLNVLIGNGDAHLKNWAVVYNDGRTPTLAPAYDLVPTVLYLPDDNLGLNLAKSKSFSDVTAYSFEGIGRRTGYGASEARRRAVDAVARIMDQQKTFTHYLSKDALSRLRNHHSTLPLLK